MNERRIRAIIAVAFAAGLFIAAVSFLMYFRKWPTWVLVGIFVVYTMLQVSLAPLMYRKIYESRWIDLPKALRKRYPPLGFQPIPDNPELKFDVVLLRPPSQVLSAPDCGEAMGLGYLAGELRRAGKKVMVIDARLMGLDVMQTVELLQMYTTPMLGVNMNFQYLAPSTTQLIEALRQRKYRAHITVGGLYASVAFEELMQKCPGIDTLVRFEGERTYLELLAKLDKPETWTEIPGLVYRTPDATLKVNPLRSLIADLDDISNPERDYLPYVKQMGGYAYVVSSRGCNGVCAYCVQQRSVSDPKGSRWRGRDPEEVADELQHLRENFGIRLFSFVDDDFYGAKVNGKTHAERVAEALIKRKLDLTFLISVQPRDIEYESTKLLKEAGMNSVILATDNFSQPVLDRYKKLTTVKQNLESIKILEELDVDAYLGIIMFDPWTTLSELQENLEILRDLPYLRPWQILSKLEVYFGSPITQELEKQDLLEKSGYLYRYQFKDERIQNVYLAIENLMKILHPSMMELDVFRWGNLSYAEIDSKVLEYRREQLKQVNKEYNRSALDLALTVVNRQAEAQEAVAPDKLADAGLVREAELLNELTIREISKLRAEVQAFSNGAMVESIPLEIERP